MSVARVLLVDADSSSLKLLEEMLQHSKYDVTATSSPTTAMQLLNDKGHGSHDLLLGDARTVDLDGSGLFDLANGEMDLPVLLMSATEDKEIISKAVLRGAKDFMIKPVSLEQIKNIWLHVERKKTFEFVERSPKNEDGEDDTEDVHESEHDNVNHGKSVMAASDSDSLEEEHNNELMETDNGDSGEGSLSRSKRRMVWTKELHAKFLEALNMINPKRAVPRLILKIMDVPELTLQNVASHLQKFRQHLKRDEETRTTTNFSMKNHHVDGNSELTFPPSSMVNQGPQPSTTGSHLSSSRDYMLRNFNGRGMTGFRGHNYFRTMGSMPRFRSQYNLPGGALGSSSMPLYSAPTEYQHQLSTWNSSSHMNNISWGDSYGAPHFDARVDQLRNNILPQGNAFGREATDSLTTMVTGNFSSGLTSNTLPPFLANTSDHGAAGGAPHQCSVIGGNHPALSFTEGSFQPMHYQLNLGGQAAMSHF